MNVVPAVEAGAGAAGDVGDRLVTRRHPRAVESTMGTASVIEAVRVTEACTACGACLATCPERALRRAPKRPLVVEDACTACWACIEICPAGAILEIRLPQPRTEATA